MFPCILLFNFSIPPYKQQPNEVVQDLDLKGLYKQTVRKKWQKISGQPYQCKILDVQLNLTSSDKELEQWRNVRLLFVRGNTEVACQAFILFFSGTLCC
jgi:adenylylsulfate kinase-like enzyme